jgi:hypothetical protein
MPNIKKELMLKRQSLPLMILVAPAIAAISVSSFTQPSWATTVSIRCNSQASTPTVVATLSKQERTKQVAMLNFLPQYFSPQAAVQNCQTTASTLQALYNAGKLNYLASDTLNGQPTVCAVEQRGNRCNSDSAEVLFTLNQSANASQALYNMLGRDFKQSPPPALRTISRIYTKIEPAWWESIWPF